MGGVYLGWENRTGLDGVTDVLVVDEGEIMVGYLLAGGGVGLDGRGGDGVGGVRGFTTFNQGGGCGVTAFDGETGVGVVGTIIFGFISKGAGAEAAAFGANGTVIEGTTTFGATGKGEATTFGGVTDTGVEIYVGGADTTGVLIGG